MQVQNHYTEHNTSATIEFTEDEIDELAHLIHDAMGQGYISAALLQRFEDSGGTFPRLPFEPISKAVYDELIERVAINGEDCPDFHRALSKHDNPSIELETSAACTSAACIASADKIEREMAV
jgi:ribonucleotide reductase class II